VVALALLVVAACDPTGNVQVGGYGNNDDTDPQLVGSWRNQHLIPGGSEADYTRITTVWVFTSDASCSRDTKTLLFSEGIERDQFRRCTWTANGRVLVLLYEEAPDTVSYTYGFPTQHPDTLDIGGFLFSHVN
jgi:hypothetical protein